MNAAEWHPHNKGGAFTKGAFDRNFSLVQLDQLVDERKPDAGTFMGAPTRALDAMEAVEDQCYFGFRNARARIAYPQHGMPTLFGHIDFDSAFEREFEGI